MRLIDADLLKEQMESVCMGIMAGTDSYDVPLKTIDNAPTVDPVKHGHWIMKPNGYGTCSNCKKCSLDIMGGVHSNFCPNCGAKMEVAEWLGE